jgi:hypothetical protein
MDFESGLCGIGEDDNTNHNNDNNRWSHESSPFGVIRVFEERVAQLENQNNNKIKSLIENEIIKNESLVNEHQSLEQSKQKTVEGSSNTNEKKENQTKSIDSSNRNYYLKTKKTKNKHPKQQISELEKWLLDFEAEVFSFQSNQTPFFLLSPLSSLLSDLSSLSFLSSSLFPLSSFFCHLQKSEPSHQIRSVSN